MLCTSRFVSLARDAGLSLPLYRSLTLSLLSFYDFIRPNTNFPPHFSSLRALSNHRPDLPNLVSHARENGSPWLELFNSLKRLGQVEMGRMHSLVELLVGFKL